MNRGQKHHARAKDFLPAVKRPVFMAALLVLILLAPVSATWWNASYAYKSLANVTLNNATGLDAFVWNISVDTASLISAGKLDGDCKGLVFVNPSETALLKFDFDNLTSTLNGCNNAATTYWVNSSINATPYIYYRNLTGLDYLNATPFNPSTTGAVLHMGENSGSTVYDFSGNTKHWSASGTLSQNSSGKFGYASYWDGSAYMSQSSTNLGITGGTFTFTAWLAFDALSSGDNYDWLRGGGTSFRCYVNGNQIRTNGKGYVGSECNTGITPTIGQWYHIAFWVDSTGFSTFVNGERKCFIGTGGAPEDPGTVNVARLNVDKGFQGLMDEVRIYRSVLPDYEIMRLYQQELSSYAGETMNDVIAPEITLGAAPTTPNNGNISLSVTGTDASSPLANLTIWGNWSGTWKVEAVNSSAATNASPYSFTINSLPAGFHKISGAGCDTFGNCNYSFSTNYTFLSDPIPPVLIVWGPEDGNWTLDANVTFYAYVANGFVTPENPLLEYLTDNESGWVEVSGQDVTAQNGTNVTLSYVFPGLGCYLWNINLYDSVWNPTTMPANRTLCVVNATPVTTTTTVPYNLTTAEAISQGSFWLASGLFFLGIVLLFLFMKRR